MVRDVAAPRSAPPARRRSQAAATGRPASGPAARPENLLTATVLALVCFGLVMVFSTSSATALLNDGDPLGLAIRQGAYALAGLAAYAVMVRMPPATIRSLGRPALALWGFVRGGGWGRSRGIPLTASRRWISLGGIGQLQPSELAKVALALWLAGYVAANGGRLRTGGGLAPPLIVTGVLGLLILIEPDMGTATSLCVVALAMLIVAGARMRHIGAVVGTLFLLATIAMLAEPYRRERFFTFLDPWADPNGSGFQSVQAQVAIGTGGLHGVGLGDGVQKAFYLPEAHTDMILATVGEELGLVGVLAVLAGFALFAVAGYRIAIGARDAFDQALAAGLTTLVVMQAFINVGAVVGVLPVTGVPLPFVSFGGSSLIVLLAASGLLVNIGRRSNRRAVPALRPVREGDDRGRGHGRPRDAGAGGRRRAAGAGG